MKRKRYISSYGKYAFLLIVASFFMSIGYATINNVSLNIIGTAETAENGDVKITKVELVDKKNVTENTAAAPSADGSAINFDLNVRITRTNYKEDFYVKYLVTIYNDSLFEQQVQATNFTPHISGSGSKPSATYNITDLDGNFALNTTIPAKQSAQYYVTINIHPSESGTGSFDIDGNTQIETGENNDGTLLASIPSNSSCDLTGNTTTCKLTASVINTYLNPKDFNFSINNTNFKLVDENGNDLQSMTISAESTEEFDFYIKRVDDAVFANSNQKLNISFNSEENNSNMGIVNITVDANSSVVDTTPPTISNVTAEIKPNSDNTYTNYKIYVSWDGSDDIAGVDHYVIETYRASSLTDTGTKIATNETEADETNISITVPNDNFYYFKVYGVDNADPANTPEASVISSCSSDYCVKSTTKRFKWNFTVKIKVNNATISGKTASNGVVTYNVTYDESINDIQISGSGTGVTAPTSMENVKITYADGSNTPALSNNTTAPGYSYSVESGTGILNIWHIIGDIEMTANGNTICLAKGTKILLANGKTKNIEDINYDDLLAVWSYDTGSLTYEYPLWIEKESKTDEIIRITLEDNNYIDIINNHAFYNTDTNLFFNVEDKDFKVGTNIAKIDNNGNFSSVKITKIEKIKKETTRYFVGSTTYYNIIANNLLTTDHNTMISNLYGFNGHASWPKEKQIIVNNPNNIVSYDKFKDVLPHYMYTGFRVGEVGYLINNNIITLNDFKKYITTLVVNERLLRKPIQKQNDNYWMVTTSEDNITELNKPLYLKKEGNIYTLPRSKKLNFKGWFNTSDNKIYLPNDKIEINHGTHFIGIYY